MNLAPLYLCKAELAPLHTELGKALRWCGELVRFAAAESGAIAERHLAPSGRLPPPLLLLLPRLAQLCIEGPLPTSLLALCRHDPPAPAPSSASAASSSSSRPPPPRRRLLHISGSSRLHLGSTSAHLGMCACLASISPP
eukprot:CAMPEP_0185401324 /NCGR_PEP_ID=MMETSP1364-20130426/91234_1 /TAXON_ID=38817 /ORGANISM="Gephyrocapsa oceanica, Strain RCC1303" /LENGTH=139 /DNA_ID=CAMNT_0028003621 /DNA_START=526 /DNA_END=941 /DNA_ORIENTATION=+